MLDSPHTLAPMLMRGNALVLKTPVENAPRPLAQHIVLRVAPAHREAWASYHPGGYGCYAEVEREREREVREWFVC